MKIIFATLAISGTLSAQNAYCESSPQNSSDFIKAPLPIHQIRKEGPEQKPVIQAIQNDDRWLVRKSTRAQAGRCITFKNSEVICGYFFNPFGPVFSQDKSRVLFFERGGCAGDNDRSPSLHFFKADSPIARTIYPSSGECTMLISIAKNADIIATVVHGKQAHLKVFDFNGNMFFNTGIGSLRVWMEEKLAILSNGSKILSAGPDQVFVFSKSGRELAKLSIPNGRILIGPKENLVVFWNFKEFAAFSLKENRQIFQHVFESSPGSLFRSMAISTDENEILVLQTKLDAGEVQKIKIFNLYTRQQFEMETRIRFEHELKARFSQDKDFIISTRDKSFRFERL